MVWCEICELSEKPDGYSPYRIMECADIGTGYIYRQTVFSYDGRGIISSSITFVPYEKDKGNLTPDLLG